MQSIEHVLDVMEFRRLWGDRVRNAWHLTKGWGPVSHVSFLATIYVWNLLYRKRRAEIVERVDPWFSVLPETLWVHADDIYENVKPRGP